MRRLVFLAAGLAACPVIALAACSSSSGGNSPGPGADAGPGCASGDAALGPDGEALTPCAWDQPVTQPSDSTATADRAACKFKRGDMPEATLGPKALPADIPIDNIVVVMMENRSFDSYLGHLNAYGHRTDVESAPASATNPDVDGGAVPWAHGAHPCTDDTNHEWKGTHQEIDNGKMDGFVQANNQPPPDAGDPTVYAGSRAMWWYDQTDIPFYYQLANTFAVADHYHCAVPGPTWPNRMFLISATSFGQTTNSWPDLTAYPYPTNDASVLDELEKRHVSWELYSDGPPGAGTVYGVAGAHRWGRTPNTKIAQFMMDATAGSLPQVSLVDPNLNPGNSDRNDDHPPGDVQNGELFVSQIVKAVTTSPQWKHIALFITHDEHGGFYDHVPPPPACPPDSDMPIDDHGKPAGFAFDLEGVRVMLIAVSPYAKKGYVGHHVYDHTSITRFIEAKFKLPALTGRDANAEPPTDLFDFSAPSFATPPSLTTPTVDPAGLTYCEGQFGK